MINDFFFNTFIISNKSKLIFTLQFFLILFFFPYLKPSDSFIYNTFNNHGAIGLINLPTARFYSESIHGITLYNGKPDKKITLTSNPYDWLEASFFYTSIQGKLYCDQADDPVCSQSYKDKGFNFKLRLKEEGSLPAIAIGINDIAGTGFYSSEYIVSSYGIKNIDLHFGLAWGTLNGSDNSFSNPLGKIYDGFYSRPSEFADEGGQFQLSRYFSDEEVSPFYGFSYAFNEKLIIQFERDTTVSPGRVGYDESKNSFSYGFDYSFNKNLTLGIAYERGSNLVAKFSYKKDPFESFKKYEYKEVENYTSSKSYKKLIQNLENNGIGVNKIIENSQSIGLDLTQFMHSDIRLIEQIIETASMESSINKDIKKNIRIANLEAISELDDQFEETAKTLYEKKKVSQFYTHTGLKFRPFIASREKFFKGALLLENDSEWVITDSLLFNFNLKYTLLDNFDDFRYPPVDTFPAQVRSDIKDYLQNMDNGLLIGRAQFDYHHTLRKNHHIMLTGGILEDMFSGYGFEYIFFKPKTNYAIGFEVFDVKKRDYNWRFGLLDYQNITSSINFYYRNRSYIPFDLKASFGEYLAGDIGSTIQASRSFQNGTEFGIFASFTDVSTKEFGEGSFDKGIFFNIPVYGNFINYTWRPLTKDPGAKLTRRHTLHDLLVRFQ